MKELSEIDTIIKYNKAWNVSRLKNVDIELLVLPEVGGSKMQILSNENLFVNANQASQKSWRKKHGVHGVNFIEEKVWYVLPVVLTAIIKWWPNWK